MGRSSTHVQGLGMSCRHILRPQHACFFVFLLLWWSSPRRSQLGGFVVPVLVFAGRNAAGHRPGRQNLHIRILPSRRPRARFVCCWCYSLIAAELAQVELLARQAPISIPSALHRAVSLATTFSNHWWHYCMHNPRRPILRCGVSCVRFALSDL